MSNIFNIWSVINVLTRHYTRCPKCHKKQLYTRQNSPQEITCKYCGQRFTPK